MNSKKDDPRIIDAEVISISENSNIVWWENKTTQILILVIVVMLVVIIFAFKMIQTQKHENILRNLSNAPKIQKQTYISNQDSKNPESEIAKVNPPTITQIIIPPTFGPNGISDGMKKQEVPVEKVTATRSNYSTPICHVGVKPESGLDWETDWVAKDSWITDTDGICLKMMIPEGKVVGFKLTKSPEVVTGNFRVWKRNNHDVSCDAVSSSDNCLGFIQSNVGEVLDFTMISGEIFIQPGK